MNRRTTIPTGRSKADCGCGGGSGERASGKRPSRRGGQVGVLPGSQVTGRSSLAGMERESGGSATPYVRWVQESLNRILGLKLPLSGVADLQTRSAIRSFQQRRGLTVDGMVGPQTERALIAAGARPPSGSPAPGGSQAPLAPDAVRWVQQALNQILDLRLAADGVMGPQTRSAVRSFQQKQGLAATGNIDPQTSQRLVLALGGPSPANPCARLQGREVLDRFEFDKDRLLPAHQSKIIEIARCVIASQKTPNPIRSIRVVGHTDIEGSDAYNDTLGLRRAKEVGRHLRETLERILPGSAAKVTIQPESRGEREAFSADAARNRRAEILLPIKPPPPPPPPPRKKTLEEVIQQSLKALQSQPLPAEQKKRLGCLLAALRTADIDDHYINGFDFNVRTLARGKFPRLSDQVFAATVINNRARKDLLSPLFAPEGISDKDLAENLARLDERILAGINLVFDQTRRNSNLNFNNPALRQMHEFISIKQRNRKSIYFCYGVGQK